MTTPSNESPWSRPDSQAVGGSGDRPWWASPESTPAYPTAAAPGSQQWQQAGWQGTPAWQQGTAPWQAPLQPGQAPAGAARPGRGQRVRSLVAGIALIAVGAAAGAGIVDASRHTTSSVAAQQPSVVAPGTSGGTSNGLGGGLVNPFGGSGSTGGAGTGTSGSGSGSSTGGTGTNGSSTVDAAAVAKDVDPGIVDITTVVSGGEAAGTGMVLTSTGEVLTNNHVINGAQSISVRDVGNGKTYSATVVGYDRTEDVAVLQLTNASGLTTVKTSSTVPAVGASVVGVGNAGGTGGTPSYAGGTVTSLGQSITASDASDGTSEQLTNLIQTDAGIEPGDSGGPLVNVSGVVIGMDTAASSSYSFGGFSGGSSGAASQGFAIPIATALKLAQQIESGQASSTVHIGTTAQLGVYITGEQTGTSGAIVQETTQNGPAEKAGIEAGDVITSINGTSIDSPDALSAAISQFKPGQSVTVHVTTQDGTSKSYTVTLGSGSPQ